MVRNSKLSHQAQVPSKGAYLHLYFSRFGKLKQHNQQREVGKKETKLSCSPKTWLCIYKINTHQIKNKHGKASRCKINLAYSGIAYTFWLNELNQNEMHYSIYIKVSKDEILRCKSNMYKIYMRKI